MLVKLHNEASKPMFVTMSVINFSIVFIFIEWQLRYSINFLTATEYNTKLLRIGTVCHSISWYSIIWTPNLIINLTIWLSLCGCSLQSFIQLNKLLWVVFGIYVPFRVHVLKCVSKLMSISALISAAVWNFLGSSHHDQKYFDRLCGLLNRYLVNHNNQQYK